MNGFQLIILIIEFKQDVKEILPYDRKKYLSYSGWYGVSFQLDSRINEVNLDNFVKIYDPLFKNIVLKLDKTSSWIVNHEDKDLEWFPNDDNNLNTLRSLFKENHVSNKFVGALIFKSDQIVQFSQELISYPFVVCGKEELLYKNLDVSSNVLELVLKISGHLNVDLLSRNKKLLKQIVDANVSDDFVLKPYKGTSF